jgi:hypothetical protein
MLSLRLGLGFSKTCIDLLFCDICLLSLLMVYIRLFETRVASAHLADSLKKRPKEYWIGESAFEHA